MKHGELTGSNVLKAAIQQQREATLMHLEHGYDTASNRTFRRDEVARHLTTPKECSTNSTLTTVCTGWRISVAAG